MNERLDHLLHDMFSFTVTADLLSRDFVQQALIAAALLALVAGISLIANSIVVTLRGRVWDAFVAAGITLIVGLDLALIVNLSAPFSGGFPVPDGPLSEIYEALRQGVYR